jgi:DNA polymerase III sliding clamp (beta) subunit (PCNA family)
MQTKQMKKILNRMGKCVDIKNHIPILRNIRIEAKDGIISIAGTDLDKYLEIQSTYNGDDFCVLAEYAKMNKIFNNIKQETFEFKFDSKHYILTVVAGPKLTINCSDALDDYPINEIDRYNKKIVEINITQKDDLFENLLKLRNLAKISIGYNTDYKNVVIENHDGITNLISLDIHRIAFTETKSIYTPINFMLRPDCIEVLSEIEEDIKESFIYNDDKLCIFTKNEFLTIKAGLKIYIPNWRSVVDAYNSDDYFFIEPKKLENYLNTSIKFLKMNNSVLPTSFEIKEGKLHLSMSNEDTETVKDEFEISSTINDLKNETTGYNANYLIEPLKWFKPKNLKMKLPKESRPCYMICDDITYLTMPLKI